MQFPPLYRGPARVPIMVLWYGRMYRDLYTPTRTCSRTGTVYWRVL